MLVTDKFVFVHDPKQGGSFVTKALFELYEAKWSFINKLRLLAFHNFTTSSPYGDLIFLNPKHGGCRQIPKDFLKRQILTTIRNPFDWYISQYEFGWWKDKSLLKYFLAIPNFHTKYSKFPNINFAEFIEITNEAFEIHFDCPKEVWSKFGWRTRSFFEYYFRNPSEAFGKALAANYIKSNNYKADLYNGLHFLQTKNLNLSLYNFLLESGYKNSDVQFILEMKKVLPLGKGSDKNRKRDEYYTPDLKAKIRQRDRIIFEMFPEFDD